MSKAGSSNFKQQNLKAWTPIITASTMMPLMFAIGVVFVPIGIGLLTTSEKVKSKVIEYSDHPNCQHCKSGLQERMENGLPLNCNCSIGLKLETKWAGDVYFYYGLSNFHQNNFRYMNSRDNHQLYGTLNNESVAGGCRPTFEKDSNGTFYAPCGAIANSLFTDRFTLISTNYGKVMMVHKNIAWASDRATNFQNPQGDLKEAFKTFAKPRYWRKDVYELDEDIDDNNGFINNDFIVWMRAAAFPTFRKLYRILDRTRAKFKNGLPGGDYSLTIQYNYPVANFGGKKIFVMTTSSWMGGKNRMFGVGYIVVGCGSLVLGFVFLLIHMNSRTLSLIS